MAEPEHTRSGSPFLLGGDGSSTEEPHEAPFESLERDYAPIHPEPGWKSLARKLWVPIAALGVLGWKLKFLVLALFKLKIFATSATMVASVGAYTLIWGWAFALGFVLLLFVHELGHVLEARRQGLDVSAPMFIPFLGALIMLREQPQSVWHEARLAAAGPIVGSLGALAAWGVYAATGRDLFLALAFTGFFLNLFNLAPIWQLDGGRIVSAIHPGFWIPGVLLLGALTFFYPSPILIVILVLGVLQAWRWWRQRSHPEVRRYYAATPRQRVAAALIYVTLIGVLGLAMNATFLEREL
jgi:Zn-dependent protease